MSDETVSSFLGDGFKLKTWAVVSIIVTGRQIKTTVAKTVSFVVDCVLVNH